MNALKTITIIILTVFLSACGTINWDLTAPPDIPPGCENSLILKNLPTPKIADLGIKIAVVQVAKMGYKQEVLNGIDDILAKIAKIRSGEEKMTGEDFVTFISNYVGGFNTDIGIELMIVLDTINVLNSPVPIDSCDLDIIENHLERERFYVSLVKEDMS